MLVAIRELTWDDLELIPVWSANIKAEHFTSRFYPRPFLKDNSRLPDRDSVAWFVILVESRPAGHVWLELDAQETSTAVLGILLGDPDLFGGGIGRKAIELALPVARERLKFQRVKLSVRKNNPRAITCYERCGFRIKGEGIKPMENAARIEYHVMEYE
jgi:RimJ/RimL family protein N-acetyltransferase